MLVDGDEIFFADKKSYGIMTIENPRNRPICITVSSKDGNNGSNRVIASLLYDPKGDMISVNDIWFVQEDVINIGEFHKSEINLNISLLLNIELKESNFNVIGNNRLDFRLRNGSFASIFMSKTQVLRVRFNGNYFFPRIQSFSNNVKIRLFEKWYSETN